MRGDLDNDFIIRRDYPLSGGGDPSGKRTFDDDARIVRFWFRAFVRKTPSPTRKRRHPVTLKLAYARCAAWAQDCGIAAPCERAVRCILCGHALESRDAFDRQVYPTLRFRENDEP